MRLEITRKADLATRALVALARSGRRLKAAQLATSLETTTGFVPQVLQPLVARGWVDSEPGRTGGYAAAVALDAVSVLDVIEAVEGPTASGRCVLVDRACGDGGRCALHEPWARARTELLAELGRTTLAELPPDPDPSAIPTTPTRSAP